MVMESKVQQHVHLHLDEVLATEITAAVCETMRKTFAIEVVPGAYEIGEGAASLVGDVTGVIGIVQDKLEGTLALSLSYEVVRDLLPQVVGRSVAITHEMAVDAVGEITNMIFGQVKRGINGRGMQIKLGIPTVVTGKGHFVSHFHRGRYMIIPFKLDDQLLQVYVALQHNNKDD